MQNVKSPLSYDIHTHTHTNSQTQYKCRCAHPKCAHQPTHSHYAEAVVPALRGLCSLKLSLHPRAQTSLFDCCAPPNTDNPECPYEEPATGRVITNVVFSKNSFIVFHLCLDINRLAMFCSSYSLSRSGQSYSCSSVSHGFIVLSGRFKCGFGLFKKNIYIYI